MKTGRTEMKRCCSGGILPLLCRCHGIGDHVEQAVTEFAEAVGAAICDPAGKLEAKTVCDAEAMALVIMWSWLQHDAPIGWTERR